MVTIGSLGVDLFARTTKLDQGLDGVADRTKRLRRELASADDSPLFENATRGLDSLLNRIPGVSAGKMAFADLGGAASGMGVAGAAAAGMAAAGVAVIAAEAAAAVYAIRHIAVALQEIDTTVDAAHRLGVAYREIVVLRKTIGESSGMGDTEADAAIQKLQINLHEAASGSGDLHEMLKRVGLEGGELLKMGPVDQMRVLSETTMKMKNPTDQLALAYELFGKGGVGVVSALREGPEHIADMENHLREAGLLLSDMQGSAVDAANDKWARMEDVATGAWHQIAAESAPVIEAIAEGVLGLSKDFAGWTVALPLVVDQFVILGGAVFDTAQAVYFIGDQMYKWFTYDWGNLGQGMEEAFKFDSGDKWLAKVRENRREAAEAGKESVITRGGDSKYTMIEKEKEAAKQAATEAKQHAKELENAEKQRTKQITDRIQGLKDEVLNIKEVKRLYDAGFSLDSAKRLAAESAEMRKIADGKPLGKANADQISALVSQKSEAERAQQAIEKLEVAKEELAKFNDFRGAVAAGWKSDDAKRIAQMEAEFREIAKSDLDNQTKGKLWQAAADKANNQKWEADFSKAEEVRKHNRELTPEGKMRSDLEPLKRLLASGMLSEKDFKKSAGDIVGEMLEKTGAKEADTIQSGSKEAYKLMLEGENKALDEAQKSRILLEEIRDGLAGGRNAQPMRAYK